MNAIFVYGTLSPGASRHDLLEMCRGEWKEGNLKAFRSLDGWGCTGGYPALIPNPHGPEIKGWFLSSDDLESRWESLDEYEGPDYERVKVQISTDGILQDAWTYRLHRKYGEKF